MNMPTSPSHGPGRVLVIGDDMRIFLTICRALGRTGKEVHAAPNDFTSPALKSRYIHAVHRLPSHMASLEAWHAAISDLLGRMRFDLVVPCDDAAILVLDQNRDLFGAVKVAIPDADAMEQFFDKQATHVMCERLRVPVLRAAVFASGDTVESLVGQYGLPLVIKPRRSVWADSLNRRDKVEIVETEAQLRNLLANCADRNRLLVERYFEGAGVGVSVLAHDGKILQAFQHRRLREGKGGCSSYRISEPVDPQLRMACASICADTSHTGVCMFEFRCNRNNGDWVLLETNARFWGSMPLPIALGVNFPALLFELLVLGKNYPEQGYPIGIRSRNLVLDGYNLFKRLGESSLGDLPHLLASAGDFLTQPVRWLTGGELSDSFVADDPWPGLAECAALPAALWRKARTGSPRRPGAQKVTIP